MSTDAVQSPAQPRLRGLLDVMAAVRGEGLSTLLAEIARATSECLGFRTAVVNLYRPAWDDFEVVAVHGSDEAREYLLGDLRPRDAWAKLLDPRFFRVGAYLVPHGEYDWQEDGVKSFVPELEPSDDPDAWNPEDALFVPMMSATGELLGILSVDEPLSGRVPSDEELELLTAVAAHAALAVETAQRADESARHRAALERLLEVSSHLTESGSTVEMLDSVCGGIREALGFQRVSVELLADDGYFHVAATLGWGEEPAHVAKPLAFDTIAPYLVPAFEVEGCYLVTREEAVEQTPDLRIAYSSTHNGTGPNAWHHHWLFVPLQDRSGALRGLIWVDDPADRLVPPREQLQALRTFANQASGALASAAQVAALREATGANSSLIESAPVAIVAMDVNALVTLWNPAAARLFGWTAGEVVGRPNPCVPPVAEGERQNLHEQALDGVNLVSLAVKRRRNDGGLIDVQVSTARICDAAGTPVGVVAMYVDMTERKRAEAEALESAERFRLAALATGSAVYEWDLESGDTRWTESLTRVFGYPADERAAAYDWWLELVHPDDQADVDAKFQALRTEPAEYAFAYRFRDSEGEYHDVIDRGLALGEDGRGRAIGAMIDVTDRRALEEQLRQSQKLEAIGRLAGGVAHDFNNLLTAITGYGELALAKAGNGGDPSREIEETLRSSERAASLTRQLLAFSRKQVLEPRILDLNQIVADLERLLRRLIGEDIELRTSLASHLGAVEADPGQVEQIVINLALNARDAMPDGGRLVLETENVEIDKSSGLPEDTLTPGSYVRLRVGDTGTGMDEATLERIFEPFFTTKETGKGTGLGLATVYGIVKQSGGAIRAETAPGAGSTFEVFLPLAGTRTPEETADELAEAQNVLPAATVLLVEDEAVVRNLVREVLEGQGFYVLEASDPSSALQIASERAEPIHLLLTDIVMPRMSGRELAQRFSLLHPESRLLYMSGYTDGAILQHGVLPEGTRFLQKPFTMESLVSKVGEVLSTDTG
ncbi:MAG TPA: PAS domain S-box protein [Gaiellaceae bacterium]